MRMVFSLSTSFSLNEKPRAYIFGRMTSQHRMKLLLFYLPASLWFFIVFLVRLKWWRETGVFSKFGLLALGVSIVILLVPILKELAHRLRRPALAGGTLLFILFDPRFSLNLDTLR